MKKTTKRCENCGEKIKKVAYIQTKTVCSDCFKEIKSKGVQRCSDVSWVRKRMESLRKACSVPQLSKLHLSGEKDDDK